jgi:hypothetical protein
LRINVVHAAILLLGRCNRSRFACKHRLIVRQARLTWWSGWTRLIRVAWRSPLTRLPLPCWPRLPALTRRTLLPLCLGKRGINVAVHVPRFVIVVTAIAVAIGRIVHVIHFSEP